VCLSIKRLGLDCLPRRRQVTNNMFNQQCHPTVWSFRQPSVFADTFFFHLVHNLDVDYEGRLYFDPCEQGSIDQMVQLPPDLFKDPFWHPANNQIIYNPSRVALLSSDSWGTVSPSYRDELLQSSPLAPLMGKSAHPFAYVNGIPTAARTQCLEALSLPDSADDGATQLTRKQLAKSALQHKYFDRVDPSIPLFAYVGRITEQKGVHHILSVAEQKIVELEGNIMFLVGGPGNPGEQYSVDCMRKMDKLRHRFPSSFWADPKLFFTDGPLVNLGADAGRADAFQVRAVGDRAARVLCRGHARGGVQDGRVEGHRVRL
jgi:hypothetical protein